MINERLENGFQFHVDTKPYTHDFFINWRRAIHLGDHFKEEFDIGYVSKLNVINNEKFKLTIPFNCCIRIKAGRLTAYSPL